MVIEFFIYLTEYEKWFSENELLSNVGALHKKFAGKRAVLETVMDLTDCLKEFSVTVKGLVKDNDYIYNNRYLVKPIIYRLLELKRDIYVKLDLLIGEYNAPKLVANGILTEQEVKLISYVSYASWNDECVGSSFCKTVDDLNERALYVATDFAEDSSEVYFSIKENTHLDMDVSPKYIMDAPFEIEPGLINLKSWAAYELYRLLKMTEICAKIVFGSSDVSTSVLSNNFDASELISIFESLNANGVEVEFEISKTEADCKVKKFLHRQGVLNAYEYTDDDIQKEIMSLMQQLSELIKQENGDLPELQIAMIAQARLERMFGIVYEKILEYYFYG